MSIFSRSYQRASGAIVLAVDPSLMSSLIGFLFLTGFFFGIIVLGFLVYTKRQRARFERDEAQRVDPYVYGAPSEGEDAGESGETFDAHFR